MRPFTSHAPLHLAWVALVGFLAVSLQGCKGLNSASGADGPTADPPVFFAQFAGDWLLSVSGTSCVGLVGDATFLAYRQLLSITTVGNTETTTYYSDAGCLSAAAVHTREYGFAIEGADAGGLGYNFDSITRTSSLTPLSAAAATHLNALTTCTYTNWVANVTQSEIGKTCTFSSAPQSYSTTTVQDFNLVKFDVSALPYKMYFGAEPAAGNFDPSTRPAAYSANYYVKQ